jgi:hypothetical protein
MNMIKWCCEPFRRSFEHDHRDRGVSVLAVRDDRLGFVIEFRSIAADVVSSLQKALGNFQQPISLSERVTIIRCPWCGTDLAKHYGRQPGLPTLSNQPPTG